MTTEATTTVDAATIAKQRQFAARLVADTQFYLRAVKDPDAAAAEFGLTLTEQQVETFRSFDPDVLNRLAQRMFGDLGTAPAGWRDAEGGDDDDRPNPDKAGW